MAEENDRANEGGDFASRATNLVETVVESLRDRSVRPAFSAVRVLGAVCCALLISIALVAGLIIGLIRLFDSDVFSNRVWATDALVGGIFVVIGLFFLGRANRARRRSG
jgi:ABC-type multidrug transport system fused ATPase/permease subunit